MISFVQHHGIAYASRMALGIGTFGTFFALLDFWHCLSGIFGLVWFHLAFWVHEEVLMDDTTHTHRQTEFFLFRFGRAQQGFGVYIQVAFGAFTRYLTWFTIESAAPPSRQPNTSAALARQRSTTLQQSTVL
jgi:hypothetical protein